MKFLFSWVFAISLALASVHAADQKKDASASDSKKADVKEVAVISTTDGDMVIQFWPDVAPKTVENFKKLAREGFYNGTAFHRIINGFMIQGGDPNTKDLDKEAVYGQGGPGYSINAEFSDKPHVRGVISMARSSDPNSAGSQFFICLAPVPSLNGKYTDFGKLIKGDDVLTKIGNTPVTFGNGGEKSKPTQRVEVKSIKIVPADSIK
jgi:peptidyl-prolyl cis-trans isomerase B (cyclophilin B)